MRSLQLGGLQLSPDELKVILRSLQPRRFTGISRQARVVLMSPQLGGLQVSPDKLEGYEEPPARGFTLYRYPQTSLSCFEEPPVRGFTVIPRRAKSYFEEPPARRFTGIPRQARSVLFEEPPVRGFTGIPRQARVVLMSPQLEGLQVSPDKQYVF